MKVIVNINGVETVFSEPSVRKAIAEIPQSESYQIHITGYTWTAMNKRYPYTKMEEIRGLTHGCHIVLQTKRSHAAWFFLPFYILFFFPKYFHLWKNTHPVFEIIYSITIFLSFISLYVWYLPKFRKNAFTIIVNHYSLTDITP